MTKSVEKTRGRAKLVASISCPPVEADSLLVSYKPSIAIEVGRFGPAELKKALADSEIITSLLREHPKEMEAIINDVLVGRIEGASQLASTIGLTEEAFQQKGGGMLWWIVIAFVGGMILAAAATTK